MEDYQKLLKRGLEKIPEKAEGEDRFRMAKPETEKAGARTIITNFLEIAGSIRRDPEHMFKFLLQQLATKGGTEGQRAILQGVFSEQQIKEKLELYVRMYVHCQECGKHDTRLMHEKGQMLIRCEACGAKTPAGRK